MTPQLKVEEITYDLWLGSNAPLLLFEALGVPLDEALTNPDIVTDFLTPQALFNKLKTFETRKAIADIILQEGEFSPDLPYDAMKLARRLEINSLLVLIGGVFADYNIVPPNPESVQPLEAIAISNISIIE